MTRKAENSKKVSIIIWPSPLVTHFSGSPSDNKSVLLGYIEIHLSNNWIGDFGVYSTLGILDQVDKFKEWVQKTVFDF